ncbi:MAG: hypothetical protein HC850_01185 [Rhodomicrobium sp.]|nr:hypothetical protein [Rhodomicrobium sp.]
MVTATSLNSDGNAIPNEAGSSVPIDIFNGIVSDALVTTSVNDAPAPLDETGIGSSDEVLLANNAVVGSNFLEGSYITDTISPTVNRTPDQRDGLTSAIGFELYRNLGLRSEGGTAVEGAFDVSGSGLPTLITRIKIGRVAELRSLPRGVQDSILQVFALA